MKGLLAILFAATLSSVSCTAVRRPVLAGPVTLKAFDTGGILLDEDLESRLKFVADVKNFGVDELSLEPSPNYLTYRGSDDARTLYWLYVTPKTELPERMDRWVHLDEDLFYVDDVPHGTVIHSSLDKLVDEEEHYRKRGFDVMRRVIRDFNDEDGCDLTPDLLGSSQFNQVRTILHEDWHYAFSSWNRGKRLSRDINESAAQVVGYGGTIEYFKLKEGERSKKYKGAKERYARALNHADLISEAYSDLDKIYSSGDDLDKKMKRRGKVFKRLRNEGYELDNASLWDSRVYTKHFRLLTEVYEKAGSVKGFVDVMRDCPTDEGSALGYIRKYLGR